MDENGGRLILRRVLANAAEVEYAGEIKAGDETWESRFRIAADGKVSAESSPSAPEWLVDFAMATLRAAFRASRESGRWPRRLCRWRRGPAPGASP